MSAEVTVAVLDASAAIDIVLEEDGFEGELKALSTLEEVIAPELYLLEVSNVLRKGISRGCFSKDAAIELFRRARGLVDTFYSVESDAFDVFHESVRLKHSPYGISYFVLARRAGACLITHDEKLFLHAAKEGLPVLIELPKVPA